MRGKKAKDKESKRQRGEEPNAMLWGYWLHQKQIRDRNQERSLKSKEEESGVDSPDAHFNKIGRKSENEEEEASQDHSLASPEVSKTHPHERAYHEANEVGGFLQAKLGIREAEQLRHFRYEIRSSFVSVKEIGGLWDQSYRQWLGRTQWLSLSEK